MIRVSSGIKGLDEMMGGGFPKGRIILICGGPGSGKTILSLQFLIKAAEAGEPGFYITLEEPLSSIRQNIGGFGWNVEKLEEMGLLRLMEFCVLSYAGFTGFKTRHDEDYILSIHDEIEKAVREAGVRNLAIDPINSILIHEQRAGMKRRKIAELFNTLRKTGCTTIITSETTSKEGEFLIEEFLADGVILLEKYMENFNLMKILRIEKMRGVKYDEQPRKYTIDERGCIVYNTETVRMPTRS